MLQRFVVFIALVGSLGPAVARAQTEPPAGPNAPEAAGGGARAEGDASPPAEGHEVCPALFGDPETRRENRARRRQLLDLIDESPYTTVIAHRGDWGTPKLMLIPGLTLLETTSQPKRSKRTALVELGHELEGFGCGEGRYTLHPDDAIGDRIRLVAILEAAVLIEADGDLGYLLTPNAPRPKFSMAWVSPWSANPYLYHPSSTPNYAPRLR